MNFQYDEARDYVERARKCLATELAALVSILTFRKLSSIVDCYLLSYYMDILSSIFRSLLGQSVF